MAYHRRPTGIVLPFWFELDKTKLFLLHTFDKAHLEIRICRSGLVLRCDLSKLLRIMLASVSHTRGYGFAVWPVQ